MRDVRNCPRCEEIYVKNAFHEVCPKCVRTEADLYQSTCAFLRKRENRAATIQRVVEVTGATEKMIRGWLEKGRLHVIHFPNLSYPCDRCSTLIQTGRICGNCIHEIKTDMQLQDDEYKSPGQHNEKHESSYYIHKK